VVIDLSHVTHSEKIAYVRAVLPALACLRRQTGLPHRIVVDEAHYFLRDAEMTASIDFDSNAYTFITYRASQLEPRVMAASQAIIVTSESDPVELAALQALCRDDAARGAVDAVGESLLHSLLVGQA